MKNNYEHVILVGDIHGEWDALFRKIASNGIKQATLICVGDVGIGYPQSKSDRFLKILNATFSDLEIEFIGIRGNHDDPAFFQGNHEYSHFKLIPDYSFYKINDYDVLLIGGALSVDRTWTTPKVSYWEGETVVYDEDKIKKCDILITHACPQVFHPFHSYDNLKMCIEREEEVGRDLVKNLQEEGKMMDKILQQSGADRHYCGHLHVSNTIDAIIDKKKVTHRLLDILELYELK